MVNSKNLFLKVSNIEKEYSANPIKYKPECRTSLEMLINFIEGCNLHPTKNYKFICKNFRLPFAELYTKYRTTVREIKKTTFQRSYYECIEEYNALFSSIADIESAYLSEDINEISKVNHLIRISIRDKEYCEDFYKTLGINYRKYFTKGRPENSYELTECEREIAFLKTYDSDSIKETIGTIDLDKLRYLISLLQKPLFTANKTKGKDSGKTYYKHNKTMNTTKVELLEQLNKANPLEPTVATKYLPSETDPNEEQDLFLTLEERVQEVEDTIYSENIINYIPNNAVINKVLNDRLLEPLKEINGTLEPEYITESMYNSNQMSMALYKKLMLVAVLHYSKEENFKSLVDTMSKGMITYTLDNCDKLFENSQLLQIFTKESLEQFVKQLEKENTNAESNTTDTL